MRKLADPVRKVMPRQLTGEVATLQFLSAAALALTLLLWGPAVLAFEENLLSKGQVESLILSALTREMEPLGLTNVQIRFTQFPEKFTYPAGTEFILEEMAGHRRLGIRRFKVTAVGERGVRKTAFCATAVSAEGPDIRARYHIPAGTRVAESDLAVRRTRLTDLPTDAVTDPAQVVDQEANRNITQGDRLELDYFRRPYAVLKGEIIEVQLNFGHVQAKVFGEAQSSGFVGDRLPFKNTLSLKRFFAKITGPRQAQILWDEGREG